VGQREPQSGDPGALGGLERVDSGTSILVVLESGTGPAYPFSGEKLSPVLTLYRTSDFGTACEQVRAIYGYQGAGHSVGLHSSNAERAVKIGLSLPACRVIVNQAHCFVSRLAGASIMVFHFRSPWVVEPGVVTV
jgi:sulfoacetaldehyde dehydrogenase